jgi:hypothetical protein
MNAEVLARQKRHDRYQLIAEYEPSRLVRIIAAQSPPVPKSQTKTVFRSKAPDSPWWRRGARPMRADQRH